MTNFTEEFLIQQLRNNPHLALENQDASTAPQRPAMASKVTGGQSTLEATFSQAWWAFEGPTLIREYRFHPTRKWAFDFACTKTMVAVEVEGGTRGNGRHNRHEGYRNDAIKYNAAILAGWRVFRLTSDMLDYDNIQPIIEFIREAHPCQP